MALFFRGHDYLPDYWMHYFIQVVRHWKIGTDHHNILFVRECCSMLIPIRRQIILDTHRGLVKELQFKPNLP